MDWELRNFKCRTKLSLPNFAGGYVKIRSRFGLGFFSESMVLRPQGCPGLWWKGLVHSFGNIFVECGRGSWRSWHGRWVMVNNAHFGLIIG